MIRIDIEPVWHFRREAEPRSVRVMLGFLNDIRATGKITHAATAAGMSYRHAWNLIERWGRFFDAPLVLRKQGRGTTLTPLGEKLVWAGRRLEAGLGPQIQNLCRELETEITQLLPPSADMIRIHASHGFAVSTLLEALSREPGMHVDIRYVGNLNALTSLARGGCEVAGMHLPLGELRRSSVAAARPLLDARTHRVIGFVSREMGLMVKRGNPLNIDSIERLGDPAVRFVNRDPQSGTRMLFDQLRLEHHLDEAAINGYEHVEFTHAAVAAYVASGMADVAFGVEAAARKFGLDFVRILTEDYFLVCGTQVLTLEPVQRMLALMRRADFQQAIRELPGYRLRDIGDIKSVNEAFRD